MDGTIHDRVWTLKTFQEVTKKFTADHPDFLGARMIISAHRYIKHQVLCGITIL